MKKMIGSTIVFMAFMASFGTAQQENKPLLFTPEVGILRIGSTGANPFSGICQIKKAMLTRWGEDWAMPLESSVVEMNKNKSTSILMPGIELRVIRNQGAVELIYSERLHWLHFRTIPEDSDFLVFSKGNSLVLFPKLFTMEGTELMFGYQALNVEAQEAEVEIIQPKIDYQDERFLERNLNGFVAKPKEFVEWNIKLGNKMTVDSYTPQSAQIARFNITLEHTMVITGQEGQTKIVIYDLKENKVVRAVLITSQKAWMIRLSPILKTQPATQPANAIRRKLAASS